MKARELYNRGQGGRFPSFEFCSDFRVHDTSPAKPENKIQLINNIRLWRKCIIFYFFLNWTVLQLCSSHLLQSFRPFQTVMPKK